MTQAQITEWIKNATALLWQEGTYVYRSNDSMPKDGLPFRISGGYEMEPAQ